MISPGSGGLRGVDVNASGRRRVYRNETGNIMTERFGGDWLPRRPLCRPAEAHTASSSSGTPLFGGMLWGVRDARGAPAGYTIGALPRRVRGAEARTRIYTRRVYTQRRRRCIPARHGRACHHY